MLKWTKTLIAAEAKKFNHKKDWCKNSPSSYNAARRLGIVKECAAHMSRPPTANKKWTLETVEADARLYKSKIEWQTKSAGAYLAACRNGWIDKVGKHMERVSVSGPEKEILGIVKQYYPLAATRRFKNNSKFFTFKRLEIDIFIPELNKGIQFDGEYWHSTAVLRKNRKNWKVEEIKNYHQNKDKFFLEKGIKIMYVAESTWNSSKEDCIRAILKYIEVLPCD